MVFAAGRGERMRKLTEDCAKPALPLVGVPVLGRVLDRLRKAGVREVVVNLHHAPESLEPTLIRASREGMEVLRSEERELLGTSGGLRRAVSRFASRGFGRTPFLLMNADALSFADLGRFADAHRRGGGWATLLANPRPGPDFSRERRLGVDADGRLTGLLAAENPGPVFCGTWMLEPSALELLKPGTKSLSSDLLPGLIRTGSGRVAFSRAGWCEIGTPARYLAASLSLLRRFRSAPRLPAGVQVARSATVTDPGLLGTGVVIGEDALVTGSLLLDEVAVGARAVVRDSLVARGERVPEDARLSGVLFARGIASPL